MFCFFQKSSLALGIMPFLYLFPSQTPCRSLSFHRRINLESWRKTVVRVYYFQQPGIMLNSQLIALHEKKTGCNANVPFWLSFDLSIYIFTNNWLVFLNNLISQKKKKIKVNITLISCSQPSGKIFVFIALSSIQQNYE